MRRLIYLGSANEDLRWFFLYYTRVFPEGGPKARKRLAEVETLLSDNPLMGRPIAPDPLRLFHISRTPFSLIYRVTDTRIEVLRVIDDRGV